MHKPIAFKGASDMPAAPVSLGTMLWNKTGAWRYLRPVYESHTPPCNNRCPAGEQVQGYLALAKDGEFDAAWELLREDNPLPGVCGRVCDHPCEAVCNRGGFDEPLAVHLVERFLADAAAERGSGSATAAIRWPERVAVIGSGPAGLSCAYHLARRGYQVTIFEALAAPGGMLRVGIPHYRLPREVLDREIASIVSMGVSIKTGVRAGRDFGLDDLSEFAAVFVATGAHRGRRLGIVGEDQPGVVSGLAFLSAANRREPLAVGSRVAVIGGGNSAVDVARVALRLGAQTTLVYRRERVDMPAIAGEVRAAQTEGVIFSFLTVPSRITRGTEGLLLECQLAEPGPPDASGRRLPVVIPDHSVTFAVDTVITAIGEDPDLSFLPADYGSLDKVLVGGDAVLPAERRRVSEAIGAGKRGAVAIHARLRGAVPTGADLPWVVTPDRLNLDYFGPAPRSEGPALEPAARKGGFREVNGGITAATAVAEAERCFSCGVCTRCDVCWAFCPDIAIARVTSSPGYAINYDYCKGCGVCAAECPRAAMAVYEEKLETGAGGAAL